ncbi:major capsid protein [Treponema socranskii]|uniref:major capsid protein n=1 Tax=Treponema socranskii TaxID=53419 RepID=UPI003D6FC058
MDVFGQVPVRHLKRSRFRLDNHKMYSCDMGEVHPVYFREVIPGDVLKISASALVRLLPMVSVPMTGIKFITHFWYVPSRVLYQQKYPEIAKGWETFIFGGKKGDGKTEAGITPTLPIWVPNKDSVRISGSKVVNGALVPRTGNADAVGSLWDAFGFPTDVGYSGLTDAGMLVRPSNAPINYSAYCPLAFPLIAYNYIYNECYRNENLEEERKLDDMGLFLCTWTSNYFTSSLPWQQRGEPVALPLSSPTISLVPASVDNAKLYLERFHKRSANGSFIADPPFPDFNSTYSGTGQNGFEGFKNSFGEDVLINHTGNVLPANFRSSASIGGGAEDHVAYSRFPLESSSFADVSDMRLMFQTQRFMERMARGGARYVEGLLSVFGVAPNDDTLQRPHFIGGTKSMVLVNEVVQTSSSVSNSPQGNLASRGVSIGGDFVGKFHAREHGYVIGLAFLRPDQSFSSQGIHREMLRRSRYDFYLPEFANLSEQEVREAELIAAPVHMTPAQLGDGAAGLFGYQGRYDEYRAKTTQVCGDMRQKYGYWHLARQFNPANPPQLNSSFIRCYPRKDIFAVHDENCAVIEILTRVDAWRPMPLIPVPGLIDH